MNTNHKELIAALERIPKLYKEFCNYEKNLQRAKEEKKKLSLDAYNTKILNFEATEKESKHLKQRLYTIGTSLDAAQPDFKLSYESKAMLQKYISAVGRIGVSQRIKAQLDLLELLEMKETFKTMGDLLDGAKVEALKKYLKGRK